MTRQIADLTETEIKQIATREAAITSAHMAAQAALLKKYPKHTSYPKDYCNELDAVNAEFVAAMTDLCAEFGLEYSPF